MIRPILLASAVALLAGAAMAQNPPYPSQPMPNPGPMTSQSPVVVAPSLQGQAAMPHGRQVAREQVLAACQGDIAALCPGVTGEGERVLQCLKANEGRLSPRCRDASAQLRAVMKGGG